MSCYGHLTTDSCHNQFVLFGVLFDSRTWGRKTDIRLCRLYFRSNLDFLVDSKCVHQLSNIYLLCVSCPSANEFFRRYYFYFLSDQAKILIDHFNVLDELWGEIATGFDNRWRISPKTSIVKIARFRQRYNVAESGQSLRWGSMGIFFFCCRIQLKFRIRVRLKRW